MKSTRGVFGALFCPTIFNVEEGIPCILLLQRVGSPDGTGYPGQWELPGGRQNEGETDEITIVRRFYEETGLVVSSLGEISQTLSAPAGVVTAAPDGAVVHLCELKEGKLVSFPTSSHMRGRWVPLSEIFSGNIKILTNPTTKGYVSRMARMILAGFIAHQEKG